MDPWKILSKYEIESIIKILLQSATEVYYKMHQVLQSVAEAYIKVRRVIQSVAEVYCKVCHVLQSESGVTKCDRLLL